MKRIRRWNILLLAFILLIAAQLIGCSKAEPQPLPVQPEKTEQQVPVNAYVIDAELNAVEKRLNATQQVTYQNNDQVELKELYFHVYTNAFREKETAPFLFDDFERAYARGFKPGYTEISSIERTDNGTRSALEYSLQGEGNTILKVVLPESLGPGKSITLEMKYSVLIPPAGDRFGYGEKHFNLGNWYPVAAVYDETGWNLDKYYSIGDPFYSDAANYTVTVKAPKDYIIAASGRLAEDRTEGETRIWRFEAENMRDFAFIANTDFLVAEEEKDGILIKSYYYTKHPYRGQKALDYAKEAIQIFNSKFGRYPYPNYSVVETDFPSGMEYPGLVYISDRYYDVNSNVENIVYTVVHETAHQWWYGIIGNDQIDEAWLDEGFATYSEVVFAEEEYGKQKGEIYFDNIDAYAADARSSNRFDGKVLKPLDRFRNWSDYGPAVYNGGAMLLNDLRQQVGDGTFYRILQTYFEEYRFKIATTEDFIRVSEEVSGSKLNEVFDKYIQ